MIDFDVNYVILQNIVIEYTIRVPSNVAILTFTSHFSLHLNLIMLHPLSESLSLHSPLPIINNNEHRLVSYIFSSI